MRRGATFTASRAARSAESRGGAPSAHGSGGEGGSSTRNHWPKEAESDSSSDTVEPARGRVINVGTGVAGDTDFREAEQLVQRAFVVRICAFDAPLDGLLLARLRFGARAHAAGACTDVWA